MASTALSIPQPAGISTYLSPRPSTISVPACTTASPGTSITPISTALPNTSPSSWTSVPTAASRKSGPYMAGISGPWSESLDPQSHNPPPGRHNGPCHCAGLPAHHCCAGLLHGAALCDPMANAIFQLALFEPANAFIEVSKSSRLLKPATQRLQTTTLAILAQQSIRDRVQA